MEKSSVMKSAITALKNELEKRNIDVLQVQESMHFLAKRGWRQYILRRK